VLIFTSIKLKELFDPEFDFLTVNALKSVTHKRGREIIMNRGNIYGGKEGV
jgi:hypothetical protein